VIVAFDGAAQPLAGIWPGAAALGALAGCAIWRATGRTLKWYVPLVIALIGVIASAMPIWDQMRLRAMIASGEGLSVTRGAILQTWHISERRRDFSQSGSAKYKTVVSEGFDVGQDRFSWVRGSCLSPAALCNLALTAVPLVRGMEVEATWFTDSAQGNDKRVVKLLVRPRT